MTVLKGSDRTTPPRPDHSCQKLWSPPPPPHPLPPPPPPLTTTTTRPAPGIDCNSLLYHQNSQSSLLATVVVGAGVRCALSDSLHYFRDEYCQENKSRVMKRTKCFHRKLSLGGFGAVACFYAISCPLRTLGTAELRGCRTLMQGGRSYDVCRVIEGPVPVRAVMQWHPLVPPAPRRICCKTEEKKKKETNDIHTFSCPRYFRALSYISFFR